MPQKNSTSPSWSAILKLVQIKTTEEVETKVIPAAKEGRNQIGSLLVKLGQKLQK